MDASCAFPDCGTASASAPVMDQEFRIRVSRRPGGGFEVAASGPGGEGSGGFSLPFDEKDLRILILEMGVPRGLTRGVKSPAAEAARRLGGGLYEALFQGEVGELFVRSRAIAEARDQPLRVTLALTDVADLMHLPWEYLYDGDRGLFLATSRRTPVVRYLEIPSQRRPMLVVPPLRVLAMISSPSDAATLDVGLERAKLERALDDLSTRGLVSVTWLETATFEALQDELRNPGYHVFHYVGHGGFDPAEDESVLLLETDDGRSLYTTGEQLGALLLDHTSLSLAVLNACEAARVSLRDPFAGVAASLIRREVPAVIAMQFPITDSAAIQFSSELYRAIADGLPIDAALGEARKGLYATDPKSVEWGTPVLFMRVPDGRIFDLDPRALPPTQPPPPPPAATDKPDPTAEPDDGPTPPPTLGHPARTSAPAGHANTPPSSPPSPPSSSQRSRPPSSSQPDPTNHPPPTPPPKTPRRPEQRQEWSRSRRCSSLSIRRAVRAPSALSGGPKTWSCTSTPSNPPSGPPSRGKNARCSSCPPTVPAANLTPCSTVVRPWSRAKRSSATSSRATR